ncbi:MAG: YbaN family protein [Treponema sp.]|jgi:uncharacterized membrane protein YbaN (DUF454 family)|nr:YbaN family protein [Treponema sp.]
MKLSKTLFVLAGFLFLGLGVMGIFLPLLPATPFLLAASFCFLRGSERLHRRLMANPHTGPRIRRLRDHGLTAKEKITIYLLVLLMLLPVIIITPSVHLRIFLIALLAVKLVVFLLIRTAPAKLSPAGMEGGGADSASGDSAM